MKDLPNDEGPTSAYVDPFPILAGTKVSSSNSVLEVSRQTNMQQVAKYEATGTVPLKAMLRGNDAQKS